MEKLQVGQFVIYWITDQVKVGKTIFVKKDNITYTLKVAEYNFMAVHLWKKERT